MASIYVTKEYTGTDPKGILNTPTTVLGAKSTRCPVIGASGEELRCEDVRVTVTPEVTAVLRRGKVYVNIHTAQFPEGGKEAKKKKAKKKEEDNEEEEGGKKEKKKAVLATL